MAANSLPERGWGKPTQPISGDDEAPPIQVDDARTALASIARESDAVAESGSDSEAESGTS
jgi:hypothetical protein